MDHKEVIIKSKKRVQKHGEVFTPKRIVKMMLDQDGIKEACESLTATFLEPSAGSRIIIMTEENSSAKLKVLKLLPKLKIEGTAGLCVA